MTGNKYKSDTCRIWLTALMWSPAVILSKSPSTQCFVTLPQPLTNSCMLRVKVNTITSWKQGHIYSQSLTCVSEVPPTWEHTVPLCHLHKLNRACQPHQTAGLGRRSSSEGSEHCRHCSETLLYRTRKKKDNPLKATDCVSISNSY